MGNESGSAAGASGLDSQANASAVAQTANIGRSTSVTSGAAKVFREFKWGLLTLFLLMVVVIGLVYDGGKKKKPVQADLGPLPDDHGSLIALDGPEPGVPPSVGIPPGSPGISGISQTAPVSPLGIDNAVPPITPPVPPPTLLPEPRVPTLTPVVESPKTGTSMPAPKIEVPGEKSYVVKSGDTLTSIASSQLPGKGNLRAIQEANKDVLPNPNKLRVGMTLKIPAAVATQPAKAEKFEAAPVKDIDIAMPKKAVQDVHSDYVVQSGDTLERIARKVFNDPRKWHEIYEWNRDQLPDPGRLRVGQVLKIKGGSGTATTAPVAPTSTSRAEIIEEPVHTPSSTVHTKGAVAATKAEEQAVMSSTTGASIP